MKENINYVNSLETVNNLELGDVDVGYLAQEKRFTCKQYNCPCIVSIDGKEFPYWTLFVYL